MIKSILPEEIEVKILPEKIFKKKAPSEYSCCEFIIKSIFDLLSNPRIFPAPIPSTNPGLIKFATMIPIEIATKLVTK